MIFSKLRSISLMQFRCNVLSKNCLRGHKQRPLTCVSPAYFCQNFLLITDFYSCIIALSFFIFYLDEFSRVITKTQQHQKYPFNFDSPFIKRFFGDDKSKGVPYNEFTQLLEVGTCWIIDYINNIK